MADLINGAVLPCDKAYYKATCPACGRPVKWSPNPGPPGKDYRAVHEDCGLQFGLITQTYMVWVADEHGNELDETLDTPAAPEPELIEEKPPKPYAEELQPGGVVLIRNPGDPR